MSRSDEPWRTVLENNNQTHRRLLTLDLLLSQFGNDQDGSPERTTQILEILRSFSQTLERELAHSFRLEERGLYAEAAEAHPGLRNLIWTLHEDHSALRERLASIRAGWSEATLLDELERACSAVKEFSTALRAHMRRDERLAAALVEMRHRMPSPQGSGTETVNTP